MSTKNAHVELNVAIIMTFGYIGLYVFALYKQPRGLKRVKKVYTDIEEMIGHTPLYQFVKLKKKLGLAADIFGKCEFYNPLFSIKDRAALKMISKALDEGVENPIVIEATSGNLGVAMAAICAGRNVKAMAFMPENTAKEKVKLIKYFGCDAILTPKDDGMKGAIAKAEMTAQKSNNVIWLQQFTNENNLKAHLFSTSVEIWDDMDGEVDAIIAGVGTGGTISGVAQALKTSNPDLKVIAVEPASSNVLSGGEKGAHRIHGIGAGFIPPLYDSELVNKVVTITDDDAWAMAKLVAQTEGLPIGVSSGAAMVAAVNMAQSPEYKDKRLAVILPDAINNYISELD